MTDGGDPVLQTRKTIAFFPAHPSQLLMLRPVAAAVESTVDVLWVLRDKDCTVELADAFGLEYTVISKAAKGRVGNALELVANILRARRIARKHEIDLWVTKYGAGNIAAWLDRGLSVSFNDDDADVVPAIAWTSYPFAQVVLAPQVTRMGRFASKTLFYPGFHELFYLHPNRFTPDNSIRRELGLSQGEEFAIVRLSALNAHHDAKARGMEPDLLREIIRVAETQDAKMHVFISSEHALDPEFEIHAFTLPPQRMLHALAFAEFFVGDSQTMTAEAAVLGTPAFRISSFVGRISYIAALEEYGLAFGYRPHQGRELLKSLKTVLTTDNRHGLFQERRQVMLAEHIDPVPWVAQVLKSLIDNALVVKKLESLRPPKPSTSLRGGPCCDHESS